MHLVCMHNAEKHPLIALLDEHLIVSLGGSDADGQPTDMTELLSLPEASRTPTCPSIRR